MSIPLYGDTALLAETLAPTERDILYPEEAVPVKKPNWPLVATVVIAGLTMLWNIFGVRIVGNADEAMDGRIDKRARAIISQEMGLPDKITDIQGKFQHLDGQVQQIQASLNILLQKRIAGALSLPLPQFAESMPAVANSFAAARIMRTKVRVAALSGILTRMYSIPWDNNDKWRAFVELANYRSFLNASIAPAPTTGEPVPEHTKLDWLFAFTVHAEAGAYVNTQLRVFGRTTPHNAAIMEQIDQPLKQKTSVIAPGLLIVDAASQEQSIIVVLDNVRARNVIFKNCKIVYAGGRTELDNVRFIDCLFLLPPRRTTELFAYEIIKNGKADKLNIRVL